jgi:hypothetical protein
VEVLSFVATLLIGYEFECFNLLPQQSIKIGTGVKKPKRDLKLVVKKREEWKDVIWGCIVGGKVDFVKFVNAEHTYRERTD